MTSSGGDTNPGGQQERNGAAFLRPVLAVRTDRVGESPTPPLLRVRQLVRESISSTTVELTEEGRGVGEGGQVQPELLLGQNLMVNVRKAETPADR